MNERKTFFLGMGVGKAGSTWLHNYLSYHPEVNPGILKEMRVLSRPRYDSLVAALVDLPWRKFEGKWWLKENLPRAWYRSNWQRYFSHFERRLNGRLHVTGEISPGNFRISKETMEYVKREFLNRGITVVPIVILRDPIDRLHSAASYSIMRSKKSRYQKDIDRSDIEYFEKLLKVNSDYGQEYSDVIDRIDSVFPEENVFYCLFENLFQQESVDRLCQTLGIEPLKGGFSNRIGASPKETLLPEELAVKAVIIYNDTYKAVAGKMGKDKVLRYWPYSRHIDI